MLHVANSNFLSRGTRFACVLVAALPVNIYDLQPFKVIILSSWAFKHHKTMENSCRKEDIIKDSRGIKRRGSEEAGKMTQTSFQTHLCIMWAESYSICIFVQNRCKHT